MCLDELFDACHTHSSIPQNVKSKTARREGALFYQKAFILLQNVSHWSFARTERARIQNFSPFYILAEATQEPLYVCSKNDTCSTGMFARVSV